MAHNIYYYFPSEGLKNKAGTAMLTIDWFKKNFVFPINEKHFIQLDYIYSTNHNVPNISDVVAFENDGLVWQGRVEKIINVISKNNMYFNILLNPIK